MQKLLRVAMFPILVAAFSFVGVVKVNAQEANSCAEVTITNTGAGSNNQVNCGGVYTITINCSNETQTVINVTQNGTSGTATVTENANSGDAVTGDVINFSDINAVIDSNNCIEDEEVVVVTTEPVVPTTQTTPTPPATPEVKAATKVAVLPSTGVLTPVQTVSIAIAAFAAVVAGSKAVLFFAKKS